MPSPIDSFEEFLELSLDKISKVHEEVREDAIKFHNNNCTSKKEDCLSDFMLTFVFAMEALMNEREMEGKLKKLTQKESKDTKLTQKEAEDDWSNNDPGFYL